MTTPTEVASKNFFSEYAVLNGGTEIPPTFTAWCSISAVSAVLGRRVFVNMGPFTIFPNIYVALIATSGQIRKSTAMNVTKNMLKLITPKLNFLPKSITKEALHEAMAVNNVINGTKITIGGGDPIGQGFLLADELSGFLNQKTTESGLPQLLTQFYDCADSVDYQTKIRGKEVLRDTQLGILSGTTPEELRNAISPTAIGSGLASRFFFIYENVAAPPQYRPEYSSRQLEAQEYCQRFLQRCTMISGKVSFPEEIWTWLKDFYDNRCYTHPFNSDPYLMGYASRRYVHIFKLAMNLAVGQYESPIPTISVLERAERLLIWNEENLQRVIQLVTMSEKGAVIHDVLAVIRKHKKINKVHLMRAMSHRIDTRELTEVIQTLITTDQINVLASGPNIFYLLK